MFAVDREQFAEITNVYEHIVWPCEITPIKCYFTKPIQYQMHFFDLYLVFQGGVRASYPVCPAYVLCIVKCHIRNLLVFYIV